MFWVCYGYLAFGITIFKCVLRNFSIYFLLFWDSDGGEAVKNSAYPFVDVRDVAESILLVYENPDAVGRFICSSDSVQAQALVEKLKSMYPNYNYPKR